MLFGWLGTCTPRVPVPPSPWGVEECPCNYWEEVLEKLHVISGGGSTGVTLERRSSFSTPCSSVLPLRSSSA